MRFIKKTKRTLSNCGITTWYALFCSIPPQGDC